MLNPSPWVNKSRAQGCRKKCGIKLVLKLSRVIVWKLLINNNKSWLISIMHKSLKMRNSKKQGNVKKSVNLIPCHNIKHGFVSVQPAILHVGMNGDQSMDF